ncbi:MAG: hypothetical protein ABSB15_22610 [Bryobacteraceae bacterium]|jgi:hypothetical protein
MAIFVVMGLGDPAALGEAIQEHFPDEYYALESDKWFVSADGVTSKDIAIKLGMRKADKGITGIVLPISGYNGLASPDIWEWLRAKMARPNG